MGSVPLTVKKGASFRLLMSIVITGDMASGDSERSRKNNQGMSGLVFVGLGDGKKIK